MFKNGVNACAAPRKKNQKRKGEISAEGMDEGKDEKSGLIDLKKRFPSAIVEREKVRGRIKRICYAEKETNKRKASKTEVVCC